MACFGERSVFVGGSRRVLLSSDFSLNLVCDIQALMQFGGSIFTLIGEMMMVLQNDEGGERGIS